MGDKLKFLSTPSLPTKTSSPPQLPVPLWISWDEKPAPHELCPHRKDSSHQTAVAVLSWVASTDTQPKTTSEQPSCPTKEEGEAFCLHHPAEQTWSGDTLQRLQELSTWVLCARPRFLASVPKLTDTSAFRISKYDKDTTYLEALWLQFWSTTSFPQKVFCFENTAWSLMFSSLCAVPHLVCTTWRLVYEWKSCVQTKMWEPEQNLITRERFPGVFVFSFN